MAALEARGISAQHVDPRSLFVSSARAWSGPTVAINREIGHFRALYAASSLELAGVTVVNSGAATRVCGDKWHTSAALLAAGLPTPRTALAMTSEAALDALDDLGYPAVIKPLVGSWGRLVSRVPHAEAAGALLEYVSALPSPQSHIVYLQQEVKPAERDLRVIVVGGRALGAMCRRAEQWRANVARGAATEPCTLTPAIERHAVLAAQAVGADVAGVDLIESADGELFVIEVNDRVEFRGFQQAHAGKIDVAAALAAHLDERLGR